MHWYLNALKKYAAFTGRAHRTAYWMFVLISTLISIAITVVFSMISQEAGTIVSLVYSLAVLIPYISVGVRRMHDIDRSGWWILVPIVNWVFFCIEGTQGNNRFGGDPKAFMTTT